jgi:hypothetical protein
MYTIVVVFIDPAVEMLLIVPCVAHLYAIILFSN